MRTGWWLLGVLVVVAASGLALLGLALGPAAGAIGVAAAALLLLFGAVPWRLRRRIREATDRVAGLARRGRPPGISAPAVGLTGDLDRAISELEEHLDRRLVLLEEERTDLHAILASMVEGVVAVDTDERIRFVNRSARSLLRLQDEGLTGRPLWEHCLQHQVNESLRRVLGDGEPLQLEIRITMRERDRHIDLHADAVRDQEGAVTGALAVLHDVTEYRQLEQIRRDFVANASHELKTPLTVILSVVETIINDGEMSDGTRSKFLRRIQAQGQRLNLIISDLLALSRLENTEAGLERDCFDLGRLVRSICNHLRPAAERKRQILTAFIDETPITVSGQMSALRTAVENVIDNAVKYTSDDGRIEVSCLRDGARCVIAVTDTGIGITPADQKRIFERFYRVDKARSRELGGTGLGLAIAKHVALAHGGELTVDSTPGCGSTFSFVLPVVPASPDGTEEVS